MNLKQSLLQPPFPVCSSVYVPLDPISYSFLHPLCFFTKETQLFLCSFPSFPKETKAWIFQFLTSCKVIPIDSLFHNAYCWEKYKNWKFWPQMVEAQRSHDSFSVFITFSHFPTLFSHCWYELFSHCWYDCLILLACLLQPNLLMSHLQHQFAWTVLKKAV